MGVEFLFTWPNDLPKRSFFHTVILLPMLLWPSFGFKLQWRHSLVKHVMQGWRLVSILLPHLSAHCFLILLTQIVPMWMCLLDFPTQPLHVSVLSWALFNTAGVGRVGLHGQDGELEFGQMAKDMRTYLPSEGKSSPHMSESKPQIGESSRQRRH